MQITAGQGFGLDLGGGIAIRLTWIEPLGVWLGRAPVSRREFRRLDPKHGSDEDQPVVRVSWDEASRYVRRLNELAGAGLPSGFRFRLPHEAEWESGARCERVAGPVWDERCPGFGNYDVIDSSGIGREPAPPAENAWGLCGMENGLWEWVEDVFDPTMNRRILRGACWYGPVTRKPVATSPVWPV